MALSKAPRRIRTREQGAAGQLLKEILALPPGDQRGRLNEEATLAVLGSKRVGNLRAEITRLEQVFRRASWSSTLVTNWYTSGETPIFAERLRLPAIKGITERQDAGGRRLRRNPQISVSMVPAVVGEWVTEPAKDGSDKTVLVRKRQPYRRLVPTIQRAQEDWYDGMSVEYANFMREFERGPKRLTSVTPASMVDPRDAARISTAADPRTTTVEPVERVRRERRRRDEGPQGVPERQLAEGLGLRRSQLRAAWASMRHLPEPEIVVVYVKRDEKGRAVQQRRRRVYDFHAVSEFYVALAGIDVEQGSTDAATGDLPVESAQ